MCCQLNGTFQETLRNTVYGYSCALNITKVRFPQWMKFHGYLYKTYLQEYPGHRLIQFVEEPLRVGLI